MIHTYQITGMTCSGCQSLVEESLSQVKGVKKASVNLKKAEAVIEMEHHIPVENFQNALRNSHYSIALPGNGADAHAHHSHKNDHHKPEKGSGIYYCPMHCEGEKTYDKPGDCPVCGMHLVEQPAAKKATQYTCPMHPEVVKDEPGSWPICGMELVPMEAEDE